MTAPSTKHYDYPLLLFFTQTLYDCNALPEFIFEEADFEKAHIVVLVFVADYVVDVQRCSPVHLLAALFIL